MISHRTSSPMNLTPGDPVQWSPSPGRLGWGEEANAFDEPGVMYFRVIKGAD